MDFEKGDIVKLKNKNVEFDKNNNKIEFDYGVIVDELSGDIFSVIIFNKDGKIRLTDYKNKGIVVPTRVDINKKYLVLCLKHKEPDLDFRVQ